MCRAVVVADHEAVVLIVHGGVGGFSGGYCNMIHTGSRSDPIPTAKKIVSPHG
jgi:hypothetical protein